VIKENRKQQGISQQTLAMVAGTGTRFIANLESGKETIQLVKVLKVIDALGLEMYIFNHWEKK
jgi:y4mF family transcriptional regulator